MSENSQAHVQALQINTSVALVVKAIIQDFGDTNETSTLTSFSSSSSTLPSSPPQKIELHIGNWAKVAKRPVTTTKEGIEKVIEILKFFINVAALNGLGDTPAVATLKKAIETAEKGLDPTYTKPISWTEKVSQHTRAHTPSYTFRLKTFVLNNVPLFNIFDAMAFIYTLCVEDLFAVTDCQLHLYQFRLIIRAFCGNMWHSQTFVPSTVAATWYETTPKKPLTIGFATACIGRTDSKKQMNKARKVFCEGVFTLATESELELCPPKSCPNFPGNCPEYLIWGMICRNEGNYSSLCLNVFSELAIKFCGYCEEMAKVATSKKNVHINDLWNKSILIKSSEVVDENALYPGCNLKDLKRNSQGEKRIEREKVVFV